VPSFRRGAFALFAVAFVVTLLLGDRPFADSLTLQADALLQGRLWWTPLTALFRHAEGLATLGLLWMLIVQAWLGSQLESFWGSARYLTLSLCAGVVGLAGASALGLVIPALRAASWTGSAPLDLAAVVAFGFVFADQPQRVAGREISSRTIALVAGLVVLGFPLVVALREGIALSSAWPSLVPALIAGGVATLFVQPWRTRPTSGKVERAKHRGQPHLRVVRNADDMLNRASAS
jgi:membrane associated rhomboid family serine protease